MDLALDDIIRAGKGRGSGGGRRGGGRGVGRRGGSGGGGRTAGGIMFTKAVPGGRWKHDKFNEIYGGGSGGATAGPRRRSGAGGGGGLSARFAKPVGRRASGAPGDIVKLNISNLAETVVTSDLEELFNAYKILGVTVHYDEAGNHLGTADVFLTRRTAEQIITDFTGVAIDGREMKIFVVDETNAAAIPARSLGDRLGRTAMNPIRRRVVGRRSGGGGGGGINNLDRLAPTRGGGARRRGGGGAKRGAVNGGPKTKLSADELDKELESYMGSKKHNRISIDL